MHARKPLVPHPQFFQEQKKIKLLLLGAGESGKSTIFKQMKFLYGTGLTNEDRAAITAVVHGNIITAMKILLENSKLYGYYEQVCACFFEKVVLVFVWVL